MNKFDIGTGMIIGFGICLLLMVTVLGIQPQLFGFESEVVEEIIETSDYRIKIYDYQGELIQEYRNKYSIKYDRDYIYLTDAQGLEHVIYNPLGLVTVDQIGE